MRRISRKRTAVGALVSTAAFLAIGIQTVPATATPVSPHPTPLRTGGLPAHLTSAQRTALIKDAQQKTTRTARTLGLGAKEKLVVKDVVQDNDGTVHTRYERTYAGLPVLGGDLVVHTPPASVAAGTVSTTFNNKHTGKVASTTAALTKSAARTKALKTAKALDAKKPTADSARKVIWAGSGTPKLAWETVVGGFQDDTTRGGHKTYNLNNGTSGTGTLMTDSDDVWGTGSGSNTQTAGADAAYGAQETWDFTRTPSAAAASRTTASRPTPASTTAAATSAPSGTTTASA